MQKVVYSVTKVNKDEKIKGVGYLVEGNLLIPATSQKGISYIRVFDDVAEKCKTLNKEKNRYDTLDYIETTYYIWYKFID